MKSILKLFSLLLIFANLESQVLLAQSDGFAAKIVTIFEKIPLEASPSDLSNAKAPLGSSAGSSRIFAARNSFASFNLLLTAGTQPISNVAVRLSGLSSANGEIIKNKNTSSADLFDFRGKAIELFFVRYLEIKGLSKISYEPGYDERHVPAKFRRPFSGEGAGRGGWKDRPHANKKYPDILVPLELVPNFNIAANQTQSIVADLFVSKDTAPGLYKGSIEVLQNQKTVKSLPIELEVLNFELRDSSPASAMVYIEDSDISARYQGERFIQTTGQQASLNEIVDNHFKIAHRHGISLFNKNEGVGGKPTDTQPRPEWLPRLSGSLFTPDNGYEGPGEARGNEVFFIGTYGSWPGKTEPTVLRDYASGWQNWLSKNPQKAETYFYVADESNNWAEQEGWAKTVKSVAPSLKTFATVPLPQALANLPSLDVAASWFNFGSTAVWDKSVAAWKAKQKELVLYNGKRPLSGSFATEDDGVALRVLSWSQVKMGIKRWFFWNGTYYKNFQGGTGDTNVFESAHTFGGKSTQDPSIGESGWNYSNGDGVLFYPGTDRIYPTSSYSVKGPFASLRLKLWRSGIEDAKYIELAFEKNPAATKAIMQRMLPKVLWQVGVAEEADPTWKKTDVSWSTDPEVWEKARRELANIISAS